MSSVNNVGSMYNIDTSKKDVVETKGDNLGMQDFLNLMMAQLKNQDMLNPVADTEFIAQMAQFSSLQGIQELTAYSMSQQAASMIGKYVTVASQDSAGNLKTESGWVETVSFYNNEPQLLVNGTTYGLKSIMELHNYQPAKDESDPLSDAANSAAEAAVRAAEAAESAAKAAESASTAVNNFGSPPTDVTDETDGMDNAGNGGSVLPSAPGDGEYGGIDDGTGIGGAGYAISTDGAQTLSEKIQTAQNGLYVGLPMHMWPETRQQ